jgi:hypothetical protein
MKRSIALASVVVTAVATVVVYAGTGGSAAPASPPMSTQRLAQHILKTRARSFLTAPALGAVTLAATGRASLATSAPIQFGDVPDSSGGSVGAAVKPHGGTPPNVRVNDPSVDTHQTDQTTQSETTIAVAGSHVAVGFNDSQQGLLFLTPGADLNGYAYSSDGGSSWTDGGTIPNLTGLVNLGDPWLAADAAGTMYYSSLALDGASGNLFVGVARSDDGGATWNKPVLASPSSRFGYSGDKPALTSGPLPGGHAQSVLYDTWDDFFCDRTNCYTGLPVSRSVDGGKTWQVTYADRFTLPMETCSFQQYIGAQPLIDPTDGTLYVAAEKIAVDDPSCIGGTVQFSESLFTSTDGGQSFDGGRTIGKVTPATEFGALKLGRGKYMRTIEFPVLALDGHTLYVAWNDGRQAPHSHIILFRSTDGGATWTHRMATTGDGDELQPAISADDSGIHLLYYRRGSDNKLTVDMAGTTDGTSFTHTQVSDQSFPGVLNVPNFDPLIAWGYMGDYVANVSDGGHLYLAWGDNRDKVTNFLYPKGRNYPDVFFAKR